MDLRTPYTLKQGDRVRDQFKAPKPGDECVTGTVATNSKAGGVDLITVNWDDGKTSERSRYVLELIDDDR